MDTKETWEEGFKNKFTWTDGLGFMRFSIIRANNFTRDTPISGRDTVIDELIAFIKEVEQKAKLEVIEEMERYCTRHISVSEYPQYDACERYGMNTHAEMVARFLSSLKSKYTNQ